MNKMIFVLIFLFSISVFSCNQKTENTSTVSNKSIPSEKIEINPEEELIREKIQMYFDGWMTGDTSKIGRAMQASCQLKTIRDGNVSVTDRSKYLGFFKPRPKLENTEGRILKIDITGNIGSAKCEIETPQMLFTDYFNLMKLGDEWFIVDKIATKKPKE